MLTNDNLIALEAPFPIEAHKVRWDGNAYLTELPLLGRLTDVDPNWEFRITSTIVTDYNLTRPDCVTVSAELTICGITRAGVGSAIADVTTKDKQGKQLTTPIIRALGEKELKGAATDVLKRCARQFGVGAYILRTKDVTIKNERDFADWYTREFGKPQSPPTPRQQSAPIVGKCGKCGGTVIRDSQNKVYCASCDQPSPAPRQQSAPEPPSQHIDSLPSGDEPYPLTIRDVWPDVANGLLTMKVSELPEGLNVGGIIYSKIASIGYPSDEAVKQTLGLESLKDWKGTLEQLMVCVLDHASEFANES